ncbi:MAG TPA: cation diffusion facilitator family transporter [Pseudonocardiaceae bacterium]|jgi:cation diffusion facilitator family transporter|nr:cation diffusion facilitator family transporter [Pseudonocardiaceae bacterium]
MAEEGQEESLGTVVLAGVMNLGIAAAKAVGGVLSGSSAMLSEAAHSVADTVTEVLLLTALRRSAKPADEHHPLGYGPERYFWAFLASVATFVGGAVFSVYTGIHTILAGEEAGNPLVSYLVLAAAFIMEGASLLRGIRQTAREARRLRSPYFRYLALMPDTTVKAVVFEDSAALVGLVLAAAGLALRQVTGSGVWDGISSLLIGGMLAYVAVTLGRDNMSLLIGRSVTSELLGQIREEILAPGAVVQVGQLVAVLLGPDEVLVAAKVDFVDDTSGGAIEQACEEVERRLRDRFPVVRQVFLDPTPGGSVAKEAEEGAPSTAD